MKKRFIRWCRFPIDGKNSRTHPRPVAADTGKNARKPGMEKFGTPLATVLATVRAQAGDSRRQAGKTKKDGTGNHQSLPPQGYLLRDLRGRGPRFRLQPPVAAPRLHPAALHLSDGDHRRLSRPRRRRAHLAPALPHPRRRCGPGADDDRARSSRRRARGHRSEEHTSELQSLMRISYAVFCLTKKSKPTLQNKQRRIKNHNSKLTSKDQYIGKKN